MYAAQLDQLATEQAEFAARQAVLRRLLAADILNALAELSSPRKRQAAVAYLLSDGRRDLQALGIRPHRLDSLIDTPPPRRLLKASNGRRVRTKLLGQWLRRAGKKGQQEVSMVL